LDCEKVSGGMENQFFESPILNSPYASPARHCKLDENGRPVQRIVDNRRQADFVV
jgi:type III restriction enzyme